MHQVVKGASPGIQSKWRITMKQQQLTTLGKVFDRIDEMSANCLDINIDVPDISFDNLDVLRIAGEPHEIRPVAQRSISNRLGIPYPYLRRCPPDVQAQNLNHWIAKEKNDQLLFRFRWAGCAGGIYNQIYSRVRQFRSTANDWIHWDMVRIPKCSVILMLNLCR